MLKTGKTAPRAPSPVILKLMGWQREREQLPLDVVF